jgi:hypothetical protein
MNQSIISLLGFALHTQHRQGEMPTIETALSFKERCSRLRYARRK